MKWLATSLALFSMPAFALCEAEVSLLSGVNWAGFRVEIAATPEERAKGLMFRENLDITEGMLFLYPDRAMRHFWMKNTPLPLDILFFDDDKRLINVQKETEPFSETPLPSAAESRIVLEINGGVFERLSMHEKQTNLRIQSVAGDSCPVWIQDVLGVSISKSNG